MITQQQKTDLHRMKVLLMLVFGSQIFNFKPVLKNDGDIYWFDCVPNNQI